MKTTISCQNLWVGWCLRTASTHSTLWQFTHQFVCMYHTCNLQSHCHTLQTSWLNTDCGHSYTNSTAYNVHSMVCMLMCPLIVGRSKTTTEIRHMQVTYVRTYAHYCAGLHDVTTCKVPIVKVKPCAVMTGQFTHTPNRTSTSGKSNQFPPTTAWSNTMQQMSHTTTQRGVCTHKRGIVLHWPATYTTTWRKAVPLWKLCLHRIEA